jgi:hypothetical protein
MYDHMSCVFFHLRHVNKKLSESSYYATNINKTFLGKAPLFALFVTHSWYVKGNQKEKNVCESKGGIKKVKAMNNFTILFII